ncbi:Alpha-L-arabinofuranosidase 1 [Linum perenne]
MQTFFSESNGATLLTVELDHKLSFQMAASAIIWKDSSTDNYYLKIKVRTYLLQIKHIMFDITHIEINGLKMSTKTEMAFWNVTAENTFDQPLKVRN